MTSISRKLAPTTTPSTVPTVQEAGITTAINVGSNVFILGFIAIIGVLVLKSFTKVR